MCYEHKLSKYYLLCNKLTQPQKTFHRPKRHEKRYIYMLIDILLHG
jgi:hypothetical protein